MANVQHQCFGDHGQAPQPDVSDAQQLLWPLAFSMRRGLGFLLDSNEADDLIPAHAVLAADQSDQRLLCF